MSLAFMHWPPPCEVVIRAEPELLPGDCGTSQGDIINPAPYH